MKRIVIALAFTLFAAALYGQKNNVGVDYYYLGEFDKALTELTAQTSTNPALAYFYLGEVAFAQGDMGRAEDFYTRALAADPDFFQAEVGLAKLLLKTDRAAAEAKFKALTKDKRHKKNPTLAVAIGRAYLDNGMIAEAKKKAAEARKYNKNYAPAFLLEGDILAAGANPDLGAVAGQYEQAKYFDPDYLLAYMKLARIYEMRNPPLSVEILGEAVKIDPQYTVVYGVMGRIYTTHGRYAEAVAALNIYEQNTTLSIVDIERFVRSYFFGDAEKLGITEQQKYQEAERLLQKGFEINPDHFVLNRYKMYIEAKTGNFEAGLRSADKFFKLRPDASSYIPMDYTMYGTILKDAGRYNAAAEQFYKAISMQPDRLETYDEAVAIARDMRDYLLGATYYQMKVDKKFELDEEQHYIDRMLDANTLGNLYYQAGTLTSNRRTPELIASLMQNPDRIDMIMAAGLGAEKDSLTADPEYFSLFHSKLSLNKAKDQYQRLIDIAPESYTGYHLMARTYTALEPAEEGIKTGMAKNYYQRMIEVIESRVESDMTTAMSRALTEGLWYLTYYYFMLDDAPNAISYGEKLLELEPDHANAKAIVADMKSR